MKDQEELHDRKLIELRREIQVGIDQADRGEVSPVTESTFDETKTRGRERLKAKRASKK